MINEESFARATWELYRRYGLELFDNWLTMKKDKLARERVIKALKFPVVQGYAKREVENHRRKADEIEALLAEATSQQPSGE